MLDKIIGAAIGGGIGKQAEGMDPTKGAIIGAAVPFVLRRMSLPAMVALGVGGYVVKKVLDKRKLPEPTDAQTAPVANIPQPAPTAPPAPTTNSRKPVNSLNIPEPAMG